MKTKEELLKIYSAYLPYGLEVKMNQNDLLPNEVFKLIGLKADDVFYLNLKSDLNITRFSKHFKPILYSMDMLTKEIEHKGKPLIPADFVFGKNHNIREVKDEYIINKNGHSFTAIKLTFMQVQKLLELHFNVFNLDESEYIKKETLR